MDTKKFDYSNLIVQAFMRFDESYEKIKERYKDFPMNIITLIEKSECTEFIKVDFNKERASVTYQFDMNKMPISSFIRFFEPSFEDIFISYVKRFAVNYDSLKKRWYLTDNFFIKMNKSGSGTDFYCFSTTAIKYYGR